jgi:hypothetical protein
MVSDSRDGYSDEWIQSLLEGWDMRRMIKSCTYGDVPQELAPAAAIYATKALHVCTSSTRPEL